MKVYIENEYEKINITIKHIKKSGEIFMKKNKKLLVSFAALNAMIPAYVSAGQATSAVKYDRLYNNMMNNLKTGKSNDSNYRLIERILNQRNKELKDLY